MLAWGALFAITIGLLIKRRWLEVASLMIGAGLVPTVGYLIVGPPDPPPRASEFALQVEYWAQPIAEFLLVGGVIAFIVAATLGITSGRARERLEREHEERKRRRLGTP